MLRAARVIARRDYVATVWSRSFVFFLVAPLLPLLFVGVASAFGGGERGNRRDAVAVLGDAATIDRLLSARAALARRLGDDALPRLAPAARARADAPRLTGGLAHPRLAATPDQLAALAGPVALIVDSARTPVARPVALATSTRPAPARRDDLVALARGGQFLLFMLTLLLAGTMISNMVEEKAGKIVETLAAAVPVDAIFFGKLIGMLGAALTALAVWATLGLAGVLWFAPAGALPTPAAGWPAFAALGLAGFVAMFLLWGAVYLAVGAQAGSARETQMLAMPLTVAQAILYTLASAGAAHPDRAAGIAVALVPWGNPYAMVALAAQRTTLWPHLAMLGWDALALAATIALGARAFRTNILKAGPIFRRRGRT